MTVILAYNPPAKMDSRQNDLKFSFFFLSLFLLEKPVLRLPSWRQRVQRWVHTGYIKDVRKSIKAVKWEKALLRQQRRCSCQVWKAILLVSRVMELSGADFFSPCLYVCRDTQVSGAKDYFASLWKKFRFERSSCVFAVEAANRLISFISSYKFIYI